MAVTEKAISLRDELASTLKIRLASLAQAKAYSGTDSNPTLLVGAGTIGSDSVFVKIAAIAGPAFKNVIGLTQDVWTPHVIQLVIESNPAGGAGADVGTWATRLAVLGCALKIGTRVELYTTANGTAVSEAGITGTPAASFEPTTQWAMLADI